MSQYKRTYSYEINNTGNGRHNTRYDQSYLDSHLESYALKPMSPYDTEDPNERFYEQAEPNLPEYNDPTMPLSYDRLCRPRWIRVLKLEPGWVYMAIRVSLVHINLDDPNHIPYEAISYTWGDYYAFEIRKDDEGKIIRRSADIICNDRWIRITRSLYHALSMFRRTDRPRILWADALCINQRDEEEKKYQVGLMQQVYQRAYHVLIWIGYRWKNIVKECMDVVCDIANEHCSPEERRNVTAEWFDEPSIREYTDVAPPDPNSPSSVYEEDLTVDEKKVVSVDAKSLQALAELFSANYFSRLWVFQEVALSPLATMFWGQARIRFEWVAIVANLIIKTKYWVSFSNYENAADGLWNCANMYYAWQGSFANTPFLDLLLGTRSLKSEHGRDKVYGLLTIKTSDTNPEDGDVFMDADYACEEVEVWRRVTEKMLIERRDPRCLAMVNHPNGNPTDSPSWIPNFARLPQFILTSLSNTMYDSAQTEVSLSSNCGAPHCISIKSVYADSVASIVESDIGGNVQNIDQDMLSQLQRLVRHLKLSYHEITIALCLTQGFDFSLTRPVTDAASHCGAYSLFSRFSHIIQFSDDGRALQPPDTASFQIQSASKFFRASARALKSKSIFITQQGRLGVGPRDLQEGDALVDVAGMETPLVVRSAGVVEGREHWRLIGPFYKGSLPEGIIYYEDYDTSVWPKVEKSCDILHMI